jgi:hypothetical protein
VGLLRPRSHSLQHEVQIGLLLGVVHPVQPGSGRMVGFTQLHCHSHSVGVLLSRLVLR